MPNDRKDFWNNVFFGYPVNAMRNIALDAATTDVWGVHVRVYVACTPSPHT